MRCRDVNRINVTNKCHPDTWPLLILLLIFILSPNTVQGALEQDSPTMNLSFTEAESTFLTSNPEVVVAVLSDYPPYSYVEDGKAVGLSIDIIKEISKNTGLQFELYSDIWHVNLQKFKEGKVDMIDCISYKKERLSFTRYTEPYVYVPIMLVARDDLGPYKSLDDLKKQRIGINRDVFFEVELRQRGFSIVEFDDTEAMFNGLIFETVDVIVCNYNNVFSFIKKTGFTHTRILGAFELDDPVVEDLRLGVNPYKKELYSIVNKGLRAISTERLKQLEERWFLPQWSNEVNQLVLTPKEMAYLRDRGPIKMCGDPDWMPCEGVDSAGNHTGMLSDYIMLIQKRIGKEIELVPTNSWSETVVRARNRECDIISVATKTKDRQEFMNYTTPYFKFPHVLVTKNDKAYVNSLDYLKDVKIAVVKEYSVIDMLTKEFPGITIVEVEKVYEGFEKVRSEEVYGFIEFMPVASYYLQQYAMLDLKISGEITLPRELSMLVRNDDTTLYAILEKAVNSITEEDRREIYNKWLSVRYEKGFDYGLFWKIIAGLSLFFIVIIYWNRRLSHEVSHRKLAEETLHHTNMELKSKSEKLKIAKLEAESANKAKSEFLANMTHELRTPLNAVIGFSEILSSIMPEGQEKAYANSIKTAGRSLLVLINDILDLSKIEAGMLEIKPDLTVIKSLIEEIEEIFALKLEAKGVSFLIDIEPVIPEVLFLDEVRVRQILFNLVGNADKFTQKGHVKISVRQGKVDKPNKLMELLIGVEDTGVGIPEKEFGSIFESFRQQEGLNTRKFGGTGLGLAISKKLVHAMGGSLSVESTVGEGTTFTVILPKIPIANFKFSTENHSEIDLLRSVTFESATILIVDDVESNRNILLAMLPRIGLQTLEAKNGREACDIAKNEKPDLILMDLKMPVLDGIGATQELKASPDTKDIPVIVLTASSVVTEKDLIQHYGFDGYLNKPFQIEELISVLSRFLKSSSTPFVTNSGFEIPEMIDSSEITNAEELLMILKGSVLPKCKQLRRVIVIADMLAFGEQVIALSETYGATFLQTVGNRIISIAHSFDPIAIGEILLTLEQLISLFEETMNSSDS